MRTIFSFSVFPSSSMPYSLIPTLHVASAVTSRKGRVIPYILLTHGVIFLNVKIEMDKKDMITLFDLREHFQYLAHPDHGGGIEIINVEFQVGALSRILGIFRRPLV